MSDETIPVPRALIEALRKAILDHPGPHRGEVMVAIFTAAWDVVNHPVKAVVDAVDRPAEDESQPEPHCGCGHAELRHEFVKIGDTHCSECKCSAFTPAAPSPSTREALPTTAGSDEDAPITAGDVTANVAVFTNGHRVVHFNDRWLCSRCDAVQLTLLQFSSAECPKRLFRPGVLP